MKIEFSPIQYLAMESEDQNATFSLHGYHVSIKLYYDIDNFGKERGFAIEIKYKDEIIYQCTRTYPKTKRSKKETLLNLALMKVKYAIKKDLKEKEKALKIAENDKNNASDAFDDIYLHMKCR